ncbi:FAD-dependent oxidoreductase [Actinospica robiniae]|uniref:FAD-dependent oxidoreductase n=1 Tax=Actinospica robiniae TaxID=304901 RepID=UPI0004159324|nr:BBE domain-containing protein [Actinospica robiniae]
MSGMMSRRTALRRGATVATAGLATSAVPALLAIPEARADAVDEAAPPWDKLAELLDRAGAGRLYQPRERLFGALGVPKNHVYIDNRPLRILSPRDIDGDRGATGVEIAVAWADANTVRVIPYSNGHNYAGYSATDPHDQRPTLLIDLSDNQLKRPALASGADGTVVLTAGSGTTNGDVYPWLRTNPYRGGQWAVATGRCPTVALGGLTLGGGIGFSDRKYGLTCDALVATTVVTAAYGKVTATADHYSDLFWACRGGAGNNFGINIDFTYEAHPVPERFCVFDLKWQAADLAAKSWQVYHAFQQLLFGPGDPSDPRLADFHLRFGIGTSGRDRAQAEANARCNALGEFYGSKQELLVFLEERGFPADLVADFEAGTQDLNFWDATDYTFATTPIYQWASKSAIVDEHDALDERKIGTCVRFVESWPGSHNGDGAGIALFALGAKINEKAPADTAFWHRRAQFIMALESSWADNDSTDLADPTSTAARCKAWLDELYEAVWGAGPAHCYQNFPDPDLTDWQSRYYGGNYPRLRDVKTKYDPGSMFCYEQGVRALR